MAAALAAADKDGDGQLSFEEFARLLAVPSEAPLPGGTTRLIHSDEHMFDSMIQESPIRLRLADEVREAMVACLDADVARREKDRQATM